MEAVSCAESIEVGTCLIAHPQVFIQFQIVYAAEVRGQGGNHLCLLLLLCLLLDELFLQGKPLFHLLVLDPVLRLRRLLLDSEFCIPPALQDDECEHDSENKNGQKTLDHAARDDTARYSADPVIDRAFPDEIREHPVCSLHRGIAEGFLDPVIGK